MGDPREPHLLDQWLDDAGGRRGEFHELETGESHRVVEEVGHGRLRVTAVSDRETAGIGATTAAGPDVRLRRGIPQPGRRAGIMHTRVREE
jgi:hypothetical protein